MWQKHKELKFVSNSTLYEDNNGTIRVASCPKMTPTKKYPCFKQHVESGEVEIVKVESRKQLADIFTKGLQG
eukprot:3022710-Ditylum_brightwellii.AAC.1